MKNEMLAVQNIKLSYSRAYHFNNGTFDLDELKSVALFGLVKAANTFDCDRNVKFATYATRVVDNELKMYIRNNKKNIGIMSLEYENEEGLLLKDKIKDENLFEIEIEEKDLCMRTFELVKEYKPKEQKMFYLYIYKGYTTALIGRIIGVSQSYVSRVLNQMFKNLRSDLKVASKQKHLTRNKINSII